MRRLLEIMGVVAAVLLWAEKAAAWVTRILAATEGALKAITRIARRWRLWRTSKKSLTVAPVSTRTEAVIVHNTSVLAIPRGQAYLAVGVIVLLLVAVLTLQIRFRTGRIL